jgi:hypothetical protein
MSTEPLDESQPAKTEVRGGDKPSDYIPQGPGYFPDDEDFSDYDGLSYFPEDDE